MLEDKGESELALKRDLYDYYYEYAVIVNDKIENPKLVMEAFFMSMPKWMVFQIDFRNTIGAALGFKPRPVVQSKEELAEMIKLRHEFYRIEKQSFDEIILCEEDHFLKFKIAFKLIPAATSTRVLCTSVVKFNGRRAKYYFKLVHSFHEKMVRYQMNRLHNFLPMVNDKS